MQYRFHGIRRQTGKPIAGFVEALTEDLAFEAVCDRGIATRALWPARLTDIPEAEVTIDDELLRTVAQRGRPGADGRRGRTDGYAGAGQNGHALGFDSQQMQAQLRAIVDEVVQRDQYQQARQSLDKRIAAAVEQALQDRFGAGAGDWQLGSSDRITTQIDRLARVVEGMERAVTDLARSVSGGLVAAGPARFQYEGRHCSEEQSAALYEVFEANLALREQMHAPGEPGAPSELAVAEVHSQHAGPEGARAHHRQSRRAHRASLERAA